jgi:hypothetical protein
MFRFEEQTRQELGVKEPPGTGSSASVGSQNYTALCPCYFYSWIQVSINLFETRPCKKIQNLGRI